MKIYLRRSSTFIYRRAYIKLLFPYFIKIEVGYIFKDIDLTY